MHKFIFKSGMISENREKKQVALIPNNNIIHSIFEFNTESEEIFISKQVIWAPDFNRGTKFVWNKERGMEKRFDIK